MEITSLKTYQQIIQQAVIYLEKSQKNPSIAERLIMDRLDWTKTDLIMHLRDNMP